MMLRHSFGDAAGDARIRRAVRAVLAEGWRTADIAEPGAKPIGTEAMGEAVVATLARERT